MLDGREPLLDVSGRGTVHFPGAVLSQNPCDGIVSVPFDLRSEEAGNYRRFELGREEEIGRNKRPVVGGRQGRDRERMVGPIRELLWWEWDMTAETGRG